MQQVYEAHWGSKALTLCLFIRNGSSFLTLSSCRCAEHGGYDSGGFVEPPATRASNLAG